MPNRVAWLILSLEGFKKQIGWIPWELFRSVEIAGLPMIRSLVIDATIVYPTLRGDNLTTQIGNNIAYRDAEFLDPLETIASAILTFYNDFDARNTLQSLHD